MSRRLLLSVVTVVATVLVLTAASIVPSSGSIQPHAAVAQSDAVPHVEVADVMAHLQKLQSIADGADGNRSAGTRGYAQSVDYFAKTLTDAGYQVELPQCTTCTASQDHSIIIDIPGGDPNSTIMFGAHLDSVAEGPGIEDDGSGSAALLQTALTIAKTKPTMTKHLRFAWWADEEQDDDASTFYVKTKGVKDLAGYINLDMIAAPNAGYFLTFLDSTYGKAMNAYLKANNRPAEQMNANCDCADDQPFYEAKVPRTYLATASNDEDNMSDEQAKKWEGKAGEPWDPCYHAKCDAYPKNINTKVLDLTTNALVHAVWSLATSSNK
jgi:aminopeptidase S